MEPQHSAVLSPLDQFMPRTYTRIFLVFATQDHDAAVKALRSGLAKTYSQMPYLKGHIFSRTCQRSQLSIEWSSDDPPLEFIEIPAPSMISYATLVKENAPLHYFQSSLCPVGPLPDHSHVNAKAPGFAASYSRVEGGLLFCVCVHHLVMDGTGVGQLIRIIAKNTRHDAMQKAQGLDIDPLEPLNRVTRLQALELSHPPDTEFLDQNHIVQRHPEFNLAPPSIPTNLSSAPQVPKGTSKIFMLPVKRLAVAKKVFSEHLDSKILTSNTILSALIWSIITRIRFSRLKLPITSFPKLGFAINGRRHLGHGFDHYFGNVNLFGLATIDFATIETASRVSPFWDSTLDIGLETLGKFSSLCAVISTAISRVSPSHIVEVIKIIDAAPDVTKVMPGWSSRNGADLTFTSWANMGGGTAARGEDDSGLYDLHFGNEIGKPEFVRVPYSEFDGLIIVLPRRRGDDEKIEVVVMLGEEDMNTLDNDAVWQSWIA